MPPLSPPPEEENASPFKDRLLVSMPSLQDDYFNKSVVYICSHDRDGAIGLVINQKLPQINFAGMMAELGLLRAEISDPPLIHFGGPVETSRGFVLHSNDYTRPETVKISDRLSLTTTTDVLHALAQGTGPKRSLLALGYAGWGPGQLEEEMKRSNWLTADADEDLIFSPDLDTKWDKVMTQLGINPHALSGETGRA